jgi:SAM-dependent methyltransferase
MTDADALPEHVRANRALWDRMAAGYAPAGRRNWAKTDVTWGIWGVPEAEVGMLPDDLAGTDAIELGCGTAYVSSWLARRGVRVVGIDNSPQQLETARTLQAEHDLDFPLLLGNAEHLPFPDASFDLAISEYGACLWADPGLWVPEAARVLRPGGRLAFLTNSLLAYLTIPFVTGPATETLQRPQSDMGRISWGADPGVEFHLPHGAWIDLLRASGFEVERLLELRAPDGDGTDVRFDIATRAWARQWPSEEVWIARRR